MGFFGFCRCARTNGVAGFAVLRVQPEHVPQFAARFTDVAEIPVDDPHPLGVVQFEWIPVDGIGIGGMDHRPVMILQRTAPDPYRPAHLQAEFAVDESAGGCGRERQRSRQRNK